MTIRAAGQNYIVPIWALVAFLVCVPVVMGVSGMVAFAAAQRVDDVTVAATPIVDTSGPTLQACPNGLIPLSYAFDVSTATTGRVAYTIWSDEEEQNVLSMAAGDQKINNWPAVGLVEEHDTYRLPNSDESGRPFIAGLYKVLIGVTAEGHRSTQAEIPFRIPASCVGVRKSMPPPANWAPSTVGRLEALQAGK